MKKKALAVIDILKQRYPEMEIVFGGHIGFCRGKDDDIARDVEAYGKFLEWAKKTCDTKVMNFFTGNIFPTFGGYGVGAMHLGGSGIACEADYERAAAGLRTVGDMAAPLGIKLALETHNGYLHDVPVRVRGHPSGAFNKAEFLDYAYSSRNIQPAVRYT